MKDMLAALYNQSKINDYFHKKLSSQIEEYPKSLQEFLIKDAQFLSKLGVDNDANYKNAFYIIRHSQEILKKNNIKLNTEQLHLLYEQILKNIKTRPINTILGFKSAVMNALKDINYMSKNAYPNYEDMMPIQAPRDLSKWTMAMKNIYAKINSGIDTNEAALSIIGDWDKLEKRDFMNWLKFYQGGEHLKYKTAQKIEKTAQLKYYMNDNLPGYFMPVPASKPKEEIQKADVPIEAPAVEAPVGPSPEEKKQIIEVLRTKILSRLNSAEKLLSSEEGHIFMQSRDEFKRFLDALHKLKQEILLVNKASLNDKTYIDLIIRQGNIAAKGGFKKSAAMFYHIAQNGPSPPFAADLKFKSEQQGGDVANNPPSMDALTATPPVEGSPPAPMPPAETPPVEESPIKKLVKRVDPSADENNMDDDIFDVIDEEEDLVIEAQVADPPLPVPAQPASIEPKEAPTEEVPKEKQDDEGRDFDAKIDEAFANLTIHDVIKKLEEASYVFKNREIGRQLAVADVMLDRLGLAPFFPSLAEATRSALESNQYCLTRIEDIINKLRGTVSTKETDVGEVPAEITPELQAAKEKLETDSQKEKDRKALRKKIENEELETPAKEKPEVEGVEEELKETPAKLEAPPLAHKPPATPTPTAPLAP